MPIIGPASPFIPLLEDAVADAPRPFPPGEEEILQRILDATSAAGGATITDFATRRRLWGWLVLIFRYWLPGARAFDDKAAARTAARRNKLIIKAAQVITREVGGHPYWRRSELFQELYFLTTSDFCCGGRLSDGEEIDLFEFQGPSSVLERLVGKLARQFKETFARSPGYTTDPDSGETDGPFIRFAEQAMREFGFTRDGNQPYQRRTIAAALSAHKKRPRRKT